MGLKWYRRSGPLLLLVSLLVFLAAAGGAQPADEEPNQWQIDLIDRVKPSVVYIRSAVPAGASTAEILGTDRVGAGVIIDPAGYILTVSFLVLEASQVEVTLTDGRLLVAQRVGVDFDTGFALLKVEAEDLPVAPLGSSGGVRPGQFVLTVGSLEPTWRVASSGAITARGPFDATWEYYLEDAFYTDAMNAGGGGAPLFDYQGRVLGVVALNLSRMPTFFMAIPIDLFTPFREELIGKGRIVSRPPRPWLGLFVNETAKGLEVSGFLPGSPANRSGILEGDLIREIDGIPVASRKEMYRHLWSGKVGEPVSLSVLRGELTTQIEIESRDRYEFFR